MAWNKDEIKGLTQKVTGKIKEKAADWSGNRRLRDEGTAEHAEGEVREDFGRGRRKVGESVEDLGERIKH